MEENETPVNEGYSKVKIIRNTKGINVEITANARDFSILDTLKATAIRIFKEAETELGISQTS